MLCGDVPWVFALFLYSTHAQKKKPQPARKRQPCCPCPTALVSSCVWRSILYLTLPAVREPSQLQLCASLENAVSRNN